MKAKRKLWLSVASFALVIVMTGAVVGVTLAALMGSVGSSFTISYTAKNVEASVTAMWANGKEYDENDMEAAHTLDTVVFSENDKTNTTKELNFGTLKIEEPDDYIILGFAIQNMGTNGFGVDVKVEGIDESSNVTIEKAVLYMLTNDGFFDWEEIYVTPTGTANSIALVAMYIYVDDPAEDINLTGSFDLTLDSNVEEPPISGMELNGLMKGTDYWETNTDVKSITFDRLTGNEEKVEDAIETIELRGMNGAKLYRVEDNGKYDIYILSDNDIYASAHQVLAFEDMRGVESITFNNFKTDKVTDMGYMFQNCQALTELDLSSFDTSNVTNMTSLFSVCQVLTELDLSSFDTSKVIDMRYMFSQCDALESITFGENWDTSKVTDMTQMFFDCKALKELDLSGFDTSNVTNMVDLFSNCEALTELDLSSFDTSKVTDMFNMFSYCVALENITFGEKFDTSKVTDMCRMFNNCQALIELDLSSFDTSKVTYMMYMFNNCKTLENIIFGEKFGTSKVTDMSYMFQNCKELTELDLSSFDTSKVTDMRYMFYGCQALTTIYVGKGWDIRKVSNTSDMFSSCPATGGYGTSDVDQEKLTLKSAA